MQDLEHMHPSEVRMKIRRGELCKPTAGMCKGYAQGNLVILPKDLAYDFLLFTQRNPKACPLLEVTEPGATSFSRAAKESQIFTDLPLYRVYEEGILKGEYQDISSFWREDLVSFLIGCSFTFESALIDEGIGIRHIEDNQNVPMYKTNKFCEPAGIFKGPMVVSMRPIPYEKLMKAMQTTSRYPKVHGSPVHIGDPAHIGIKDIDQPDFGEAVKIKPGEVPVFWACGVTPQAVVMQTKPPFVITHAPGYMFLTDIKNNELAD